MLEIHAGHNPSSIHAMFVSGGTPDLTEHLIDSLATSYDMKTTDWSHENLMALARNAGLSTREPEPPTEIREGDLTDRMNAVAEEIRERRRAKQQNATP